MTLFRSSLLLLTLGLATPAWSQAPTPPRPNILYLYVDDMGWGAIGPNGQDARRTAGLANIKTPNIDSLAASGINFRRAYGATVCSPARANQQTGLHQGHNYADRNNTDNARKAIRAEDRTMGDLLKQAGYNTGYWGKWGYGGSEDAINPTIVNLPTLPNSHGYDYVLAELHHIRAHTFFQPTLWSFEPGDTSIHLIPNSLAAYTGNAAYPNTPAFQNDPSYPSGAYCDDYYAFKALDFVRAKAQQYNADGTPFFALFASQIPHADYTEVATLPQWDAAYTGDAQFATLSAEAKQVAAMCTRMDSHIGNLLAALNDPNNDGNTSDSVMNNTLVIFMSDNGGPSGAARTELNYNGGLRDSKGSIFEGGIRVPMVMRWPAKINAGSTLQAGTNSNIVVDGCDLLPTFCDLAGVQAPLGIDGVSLAPTLSGSGHQRNRDFIIHEAQPDRAIIRGDMKLVDDSGVLLLYNLATDPAEATNIVGANAALVTELSTLMYAEQVAQPEWFGVTYHSWVGANGGGTSGAADWSDYVYTNTLNSLTYQNETGAPQAYWIAKMENTGASALTAVANADLNVLALEVKGASSTATQTLDLGTKTLTGRNAVRVSPHGHIEMGGGSIASLRWLDVANQGSVSGHGSIDASCQNEGTLSVIGDSGTAGPSTELLTNGGFETGAANTPVVVTVAERIPTLTGGGNAISPNTLTTTSGTITHTDSTLPLITYTINNVDLTSVGGTANETIAFNVNYTQTGGTGVQYNTFGNVSVTGGDENQISVGEDLTATLSLSSTTFAGTVNLAFNYIHVGGGGGSDAWNIITSSGTTNYTFAANGATFTLADTTFMTLDTTVGTVNLQGFDVKITASGTNGTKFIETAGWVNYGGDQNLNARSTANPRSGTYRGNVGVNSSALPVSPSVDTGHVIAAGETFTLGFHHAAAANWAIGSDTINAVLYYVDGSEVVLGTVVANPSQSLTSGYDASLGNIIASTPQSVGKTLRLRFVAPVASNRFAAIDDVSLAVQNGTPGLADRALAISGDYREATTAGLEVHLFGTGTAGQDYAQLGITGTATLAGNLQVVVDPAFTPAYGNTFSILTAASVTGRFANIDDLVTGSDGTLFAISYPPGQVLLTVTGRTSRSTPHSWLDANAIVSGGNHEAADLNDDDGDGMLNWEEYQFGTDPGDSSSAPFPKVTRNAAGTSLTLKWFSAAGRTYRIERSVGNLSPFGPYLGPIAPTVPENTVEIPISPPGPEFYRILGSAD